MNFNRRFSCTCLFLFLAITVFAAPEVRLKEIASIGGIRENQLSGIGLVTGLAGRGDSQNSQLLRDAIANLAAHFGFELNPKDVRSRNCAVVMVNATVPPFMRPGDSLDVIVSSIGDARSLEGGVLLQTPLRAANGNVYAVAQGPLVIPSERSVPKTVGTVTRGAIAEREVISDFVIDNRLSIILRHPDFVTAAAVREAISAKMPDLEMNLADSARIDIVIPENRRNDVVSFIAELERITVKPDPSSKVVIDAKSGIIIMGEQVKIGKVAVSCKSANVSVGSYFTGAGAQSEQFVLEETATVADFVKTMKDIGLGTETIIEILKAIETAGALYGILIVK